ncbi:MAG: M48 family metallopeptidase [Campylobacteraceae bacterium]|nr:M48 family metallopeptidase [Campylobacteraceae bacterium]
MKKNQFYKIISILFITLFIVGCTKQAPITNRSQFIMMSESKEIALGEKSYRETLKNAKLSQDTEQIERIRRIGYKIAATVNRSDYKWEFNLIDNKAKNAFCLPGGKVIIYTGILDVAQNDSQLATVMSHEIAHALARHGAERVSVGTATSILSSLGDFVVKATVPEYSAAFSKAFSVGSKYALTLPYGRMQESEADEIGIHLMNNAGYDVNEALGFWKNMSKGTKQSKSSFFSTHPSSAERIANIKRIIKEIN